MNMVDNYLCYIVERIKSARKLT